MHLNKAALLLARLLRGSHAPSAVTWATSPSPLPLEALLRGQEWGEGRGSVALRTRLAVARRRPPHAPRTSAANCRRRPPALRRADAPLCAHVTAVVVVSTSGRPSCPRPPSSGVDPVARRGPAGGAAASTPRPGVRGSSVVGLRRRMAASDRRPQRHGSAPAAAAETVAPQEAAQRERRLRRRLLRGVLQGPVSTSSTTLTPPCDVIAVDF